MAKAPAPRVNTPATEAEVEEHEEVVESDQASQVASLDSDYLNIDEEEETDVPEHMRSQEEPEEPAEEAKAEEAAPEPETPESPEEAEAEGEETQEEPESEAESEAPQPEEPEVQQAQPEAEEPQPETQQPLTPEEVQRQRAEWRAQAEKDLAIGHFKLPDELVEEFETNPAEAIPKLASKLYLDAIEGSVYAIMSQLPQVVQQVNQSSTLHQRYEDQFFEMWPMLDKANAEHVEAVRMHASAFRTTNPQAKPEDVMKHAGAAAVIALKLPVEPTRAKPAEPAPAPHKPAGGGAPGGSPGNQQRSSNIFEVLDEAVEGELEGEL